jgi:signal transduction histidine kinase/DNA-binding response OmpR family regulator/CHASE3 domain sensor protein
MNSKFRPGLLRNLQIGFGLSLFLLGVSSIASFNAIRSLMAGSRLVDHTDSVLIRTERIHTLLQDAESGQRGYLITGDSTLLGSLYGAENALNAVIDSLGEMTADNPAQIANIRELRMVAFQSLPLLERMVRQKRADNIFDPEDLQRARASTAEARRVLQRMMAEEHRLLVARVSNVRWYSAYTPTVILITGLLAIVIAIVFYRRVHRDFLERQELFTQLRAKEDEISRRIAVTSDIAEQISRGNYGIRVTYDQKDSLGALAGSLNKMAMSLDDSFNQLKDKDWLKTGVAGLNEVMVGETEMQPLTDDVLQFICKHSGSRTGALYLIDPASGKLHWSSGYALSGESRPILRPGEGPAGQVAIEAKPVILRDIATTDWVISLATGELRPRSVAVFPFVLDKKVRGIIELASMENYSARDVEFFTVIAENIGTALGSIESRRRLQELLEETQAQAEELQIQHSELESLNVELEVQAQKLQVSEEELKVQQEELMQTNQELEERSRALEEKNQLILIRNLEIQKKAEELAQSTKYKSEFLANMSHELRTPLNSILLLSRLLADNTGNNLTPDQTEYARVIQNSGQGLLLLIDDILDLSKIEAGKLQLEYAYVTVQEVLNDMRMLFVPLAKDKGLELHILTEEGTPSQLETDKLRLEQVLKNLLSNAMKFTAKGSVTLLARPAAPGKIEFVVRDTGIGIPEDKHELIFDAFQQADGSTRRQYGGTGLGLNISRQLVLLLGGEIGVRSRPGEGAEFTMGLPRDRTVVPVSQNRGGGSVSSNRPTAVAHNRGTAEATVTPADTPLVQGIAPDGPSEEMALTLNEAPPEIPDDRHVLQPGDKVLLIVEDDTSFALGLLDFARKKGYKGIVAVSGDAGIRMARKYRPMGILLDIQLPVKNGWAVMEELKKDPQTRPIPVHIVSSFEVRNESLQKGAVNFVHKPVAIGNMDSFFAGVEKLLNQGGRKVIVVEDNLRHAQALAYFLGTHDLKLEIAATIAECAEMLPEERVHGVILSRGAGRTESDTLEMIRQDPALGNVPIIVFTGANVPKVEEARLRRYANSIVVKTAHSYQRVLDEVSLFLHVVGEEDRPAENGHGRLGSLEEVLRDKIVLIADDDVRNIFSLTKALEQHKMKVLTAMDGKEALAIAAANDVDLVVMDMMMPEMDGFEATAALRRDPRLRDLPVIAVTAKAMTGDRERCIQAGASDYISKPVDIDQLLSLLRIWLYEK